MFSSGIAGQQTSQFQINNVKLNKLLVNYSNKKERKNLI